MISVSLLHEVSIPSSYASLMIPSVKVLSLLWLMLIRLSFDTSAAAAGVPSAL